MKKKNMSLQRKLLLNKENIAQLQAGLITGGAPDTIREASCVRSGCPLDLVCITDNTAANNTNCQVVTAGATCLLTRSPCGGC